MVDQRPKPGASLTTPLTAPMGGLGTQNASLCAQTLVRSAAQEDPDRRGDDETRRRGWFLVACARRFPPPRCIAPLAACRASTAAWARAAGIGCSNRGKNQLTSKEETLLTCWLTGRPRHAVASKLFCGRRWSRGELGQGRRGHGRGRMVSWSLAFVDESEGASSPSWWLGWASTN